MWGVSDHSHSVSVKSKASSWLPKINSQLTGTSLVTECYTWTCLGYSHQRFFHISSSAGRCGARGRSAVKCMGWRIVTCGALPAAGKRPARDSLTECSSPTQWHGTPTGTAAFCWERGEGHHCACIWFSCSCPSQLHWTIPDVVASVGQKSRLLHFHPGFLVLPHHSRHSQFWETPVQLKSVKKK